jgi:hypothetical protein
VDETVDLRGAALSRVRLVARCRLATLAGRPLARRVRDPFTLFGKTATVCLVFAFGNLAFIYFTGELIPRESVEIHGVGDFLRQMSDLLSTALLFF